MYGLYQNQQLLGLLQTMKKETQLSGRHYEMASSPIRSKSACSHVSHGSALADDFVSVQHLNSFQSEWQKTNALLPNTSKPYRFSKTDERPGSAPGCTRVDNNSARKESSLRPARRSLQFDFPHSNQDITFGYDCCRSAFETSSQTDYWSKQNGCCTQQSSTTNYNLNEGQSPPEELSAPCTAFLPAIHMQSRRMSQISSDSYTDTNTSDVSLDFSQDHNNSSLHLQFEDDEDYHVFKHQIWIIQRRFRLNRLPYFHGWRRAKWVKDRLSKPGIEIGTFLVHFDVADNQLMLFLSVIIDKDHVVPIPVELVQDQTVIVQHRNFKSIPHVVTHFRRNPIRLSESSFNKLIHLRGFLPHKSAAYHQQEDIAQISLSALPQRYSYASLCSSSASSSSSLPSASLPGNGTTYIERNFDHSKSQNSRTEYNIKSRRRSAPSLTGLSISTTL